MRPISEVVRAIYQAYWKAWRSGGGTHESRFNARVEAIIAEDRKSRAPRADPNAPSSQTTVISLRRRDELRRAGAALPPLPMKPAALPMKTAARVATARPVADEGARVAS